MYSQQKVNNAGVVLATTLWDQSGTIYICVDGEQIALEGYKYNDFCPYLSRNSQTRSVTGCTNTADAQILYYWLSRGYDLDLQVSGEDYFQLDSSGNRKYYLSESSDFREGSISHMNEILSEISNYNSGEFIAALNFYCGVKNHSIYGRTTGTSVSLNTTFDGSLNLRAYKASDFDSYFSVGEINTAFFERKKINGYISNQLTDLAYSIIRENLDYGEIVRVDIPGHSIFLDGYRYNEDTDSYEYHLNYGFGIDSSRTKWYTMEEMFMENIDILGLDISPDVHVLVSSPESIYWGGSFLRGVERINHIQNSKTSRFSFSEEVNDAVITLDEAVYFTSDVKLQFEDWNINLCVDAECAITSRQSIYVSNMTGAIILNSVAAQYAVGLSDTGCIQMTLDGGIIFAGTSDFTNSQLLTNMKQKDGNLEFFEETDLVSVVVSGDEDDSIMLKNGAFIAGNLHLGGGRNTLDLETGSLFYGNVEDSSGELIINITATGEYGTLPCIVIDGNSLEFKEQTNGMLNVMLQEPSCDDILWVLQTETAEELYSFNVNVTYEDESFVLNYAQNLSNNWTLVYADNALGIKPVEISPVVFLCEGEILESGGRIFSSMSISSDDQADEVQVNSSGLVTDFNIGRGGVMILNDGGMAQNTFVDSEGAVVVNSGASLADTQVDDYGSLIISSGGTVCGELNIGGNGIVSACSGAEIHWNLASDKNSAFINDISMLKGMPDYFVYVSSDLSCRDYILAGNANSFNATVTVVAKENNTRFDLRVDDSFKIDSRTYTLNRNNENLYLSITDFADSSSLVYVYSSGIVTQEATHVSDMALEHGKEDMIVVCSGGIAKNIDIYKNCCVTLSSGGSAENIQIHGSGTLLVHSGAITRNTVLEHSGNLEICHGGIASATTVDYAGELIVRDGGKLIENTVNAWGAIILSSGAFVENTVLNSQGGLHLYSGAVASNTVVREKGFLGIGGGGIIQDATLDPYGKATLWSGAVASEVSVNCGAELTVYGGGTVVGNTINSFGTTTLFDGAEASSVTINSQGALHVYSGAVVNSVTAKQSGYLGIGAGAYASNATITDQGQLMVWSNGVIRDTYADLGGIIILSSGAMADTTTLQSGNLHVYAGASAQNILLQEGSYVGVGGGGVVSEIEMEQESTLVFYDGAELTGVNYFAGNVEVMEGSEIDVSSASIIFDLQEISSGGQGVIEDFDYFANANSFSVDISDVLFGKYVLAGGVEDFTDKLKIFDDGIFIGDIQVGMSAMYGSFFCTLLQKNSELIFSLRAKSSGQVDTFAVASEDVCQ